MTLKNNYAKVSKIILNFRYCGLISRHLQFTKKIFADLIVSWVCCLQVYPFPVHAWSVH